jgi:putative ABC transport system permease protein
MMPTPTIARVIPGVDATSAEIVLNTTISREGRRRSGKVVGVDTSYFALTNLALQRGSWFRTLEVERGLPIAIIGQGVRTRFFTTEDPIGKPLKVGETWVTVVGVLEDRHVGGQFATELGIRDANMDVYVPVRSVLLRYRNRALVTAQDVQEASQQGTFVSNDEEPESEEQRAERTNYHQLDRIIVRVDQSEMVPSVATVLRKMLERRHNSVIDFEVTVPELLLQQERRTKTIFNIVLGAIASISLVVGGIGIMNIMLASVLEQTRAIGIRRAVGARRRDIRFQFLVTSFSLSLLGGLAGVALGVGIAHVVAVSAGWPTVVTSPSIVLALGVSITVGVVSGLYPAMRAAALNPIDALRHE